MEIFKREKRLCTFVVIEGVCMMHTGERHNLRMCSDCSVPMCGMKSGPRECSAHFKYGLARPLMGGFICTVVAVTGMTFTAKGDLYDIAVVNVIQSWSRSAIVLMMVVSAVVFFADVRSVSSAVLNIWRGGISLCTVIMAFQAARWALGNTEKGLVSYVEALVVIVMCLVVASMVVSERFSRMVSYFVISLLDRAELVVSWVVGRLGCR